MRLLVLVAIIISIPFASTSQVNDAEYGAWYMYFYNTSFKESSWGIQGDVQFRNWNIGGDLEQLLLRSGITYKPKNAEIKFTLGYGNITSGAYGADNATKSESRIYQEALFPTTLGRFHLTHRFRYEQRLVEDQDFRTRYRYNLFINVPLNSKTLEKGTLYLALYNELFINGQRDIGNGNQVEIFDRNRLYTGLGYVISKRIRVQLGSMNQTTNSFSKDQLQVSLHHKF